MAGWLRPVRIGLLISVTLFVDAAFGALITPYHAEWSASIAPGVVYERGSMATSAGPQAVYIARVDLSQPAVLLEASMSNDRVAGLEPSTEQANRKNREGHRALLAVNGDFFDASQAPFGVHIQDGELMAFGPRARRSFGVTADRRVLIGNLALSGSVCRVDGLCMPLARLNGARTMGEGAGELVLYTGRFGQTTGTDDSGTEVVVSGAPQPLPVRGSFELTVKRVRTRGGATPLSRGDVVLSGTGVGAKFLDLLPDGTHVSLTLSPTAGWETVVQAVSGPNLLVEDGTVSIDPYSQGYADVLLARTGVGVTAKGQVLLFAVDGRQPGYSTGVTLDEFAALMVSAGVVTGLNLDGGGSTAFGVRLPGSNGLTVVNRGADGSERAVGNSLLLFSTATTGPLAQLAIRPFGATVLSGSHVLFTALGQDAAGNAVPLPRPPRWEGSGAFGSIDGSGRFTAAASGEGTVKATVGEVSGSATVNVAGSLTSLEIVPSPAIVASEQALTFTLIGRDGSRGGVIVDASAAEWRSSPVIGKFEGPGLFRASSRGRGSVSAIVGRTMTNARVDIGKAPSVIEGFEGVESVKLSVSRASANISRSLRPDPVRSGTSSLRLNYDLRHQKGISAAGLRWDPAAEVDSRPLRIGLWVWGDGSRHELRGNYRDGTGATKVVKFTQTVSPLLSTCAERTGGIDWTGWKYLEVDVPPEVAVPVRWDRVYLVESNDRCDNASSLYFDDLRAVYLKSSEDTTGPAITARVPPPGAVIEGGRAEIGASVHDPSGINASSIRLLVDGVQVPVSFHAPSGRVRYLPLKLLEPGPHHIYLEVDDKAGNPAQPFGEWEFMVK